MSLVKLFDAPENIDQKVVYLARVSSENQDNPNYEGLMKYLIREKHWSPLDMQNIVMEINTEKDIGIQILRHPLLPQEFSQRYADCSDMKAPLRECRLQDEKNRQNSLETSNNELAHWWLVQQENNYEDAIKRYNDAISYGIAKEQARALLPIGNIMSRLYVTGNIRSFIHYLTVRLDPTTQKEHRQLAKAIYDEINKVFDLSALELTA